MTLGSLHDFEGRSRSTIRERVFEAFLDRRPELLTSWAIHLPLRIFSTSSLLMHSFYTLLYFIDFRELISSVFLTRFFDPHLQFILGQRHLSVVNFPD